MLRQHASPAPTAGERPPRSSAANRLAASRPVKNAVVTTLYTDSYIDGLRVLGHSLVLQNVTARRVALYIRDNNLSEETLCLARQAGWELKEVERMLPLEGVADQYKDQYTKFRIWELEEFDRVVYIDGDCMVIGSIDELFKIPHDFAAAPDVYKHMYSLALNAGVLSIKPSKAELKRFMEALPGASFDRQTAEQGFLREYNRHDVMLLPYKYNLNLAQIVFKREDWDKIMNAKDGRIIHYTLEKPFKDSNPRGEFKPYFDMWFQVRDSLEATAPRAKCSNK